MLRAGAMTYAIILSIIVGAFCMALIWISTAHRNTRAVLKNKERLIVNSLAGVDFTLNTENHTQEKLHIINNDTVYTTKSNWGIDRKSTRLNSSHVRISYAVFCLKKKKKKKKKT